MLCSTSDWQVLCCDGEYSSITGNNIGKRTVVNLSKLFAYCCKNFQKWGPSRAGPGQPPVLISISYTYTFIDLEPVKSMENRIGM